MKQKTHFLYWDLTSATIAALVFFPILTLVLLSLHGDLDIWKHLSNTVLPDYIIQSLLLMSGVAVLTLLIGIGCAWLVTQYHFPCERIFNWAMLLPLAMPAYITAYSYTGMLDVAGPVQSFIRSTFDLSYGEYWFPEIRSLNGAIFVMSFVLYPYVYLLARAAFLDQSESLKNAGLLFGYSRFQVFKYISLPIARPAIIAGLSLALMETLADYGTVDYFGVSTFTAGIFRTWYGLGDINAAAQLSLILLTFIIVLVVLEKYSRKQTRYFENRSQQQATRVPLSGFRAWGAFTLCAIPVFLGFLLPTSQLLLWALDTLDQLATAEFWLLVEHTVLLALVTSLIALLLALLLAYSYRVSPSNATLFSKRVASLGYAIPGTVIAVGVLIPMAKFDNQIDSWMQTYFNVSTGLLISGTVAALVIAYLVRFIAVSLQTVSAGLEGIPPSMDQAGRSLGAAPLHLLRRVHIPILRGSLLTATLIVFVDVMKELPATLVLRPFNFNTLSIKAYELASDERLVDAALPSLAIVLAGLVPVILLSNAIRKH